MWIRILTVFVWASATGSIRAAVLSSGPEVEVTSDSSVVIRWTTDVATGSRVVYGENSSRMDRRAEGTVGTNHIVTISNLPPRASWAYGVGTARYLLSTNTFSLDVQTSASQRTARLPGQKLKPAPKSSTKTAPPTRETWGHMASLADHFARHGGDFHAKDEDEYARMAWEFLQRAQAEGLPTKIDSDGVKRIYDPKTGAFGAYNRNGTTKTFFKPNSRDYFERQPGEWVGNGRKEKR